MRELSLTYEKINGIIQTNRLVIKLNNKEESNDLKNIAKDSKIQYTVIRIDDG